MLHIASIDVKFPPFLEWYGQVSSSYLYATLTQNRGNNSVVPKWAYCHLKHLNSGDTTRKTWLDGGTEKRITWQFHPSDRGVLEAFLWVGKKGTKIN